VSNRTKSRIWIFALGALLGVAQMQAEEFIDAPAPQAPPSRMDKALRILSWPAYSFTPRYFAPEEDRSKLARTEEFVLAAERLGFIADATTTQLGLSHAQEGDSLNTLFGSNNRVGIAASMTGWDLGFSYASVTVPRWFDHTRYRKTARIAAIAGGAALTGFRVKMAVQNTQYIR
jgi:hypothetical protein